MIPLFWFSLVLLFSVIMRRVSSALIEPRYGVRVSRLLAGVAALVVATALTWWLLDLPGQLRFLAAVRSLDSTTVRLSEPHPLLPTNGLWLFGISAALCLAAGVLTWVWSDRRSE